MNPFSKLGAALLWAPSRTFLDRGVGRVVNSRSLAIEDKAVTHIQFDGAMRSRVVTVGPAPDVPELLTSSQAGDGCIPIDDAWSAEGEKLVDALNSYLSENDVELRFKWQPGGDRTADTPTGFAAIGLARCENLSQPAGSDWTAVAPIQRVWHLPDSTIVSAQWIMVLPEGGTVGGDIHDGRMMVAPGNATWWDELVTQGQEVFLSVRLDHVSMDSGQDIRWGGADLTVDPLSGSVLNGTLISIEGAPANDVLTDISLVCLPDQPGPDSASDLTRALLERLGMAPIKDAQADVQQAVCEPLPTYGGTSVVASVLRPTDQQCRDRGFWPGRADPTPPLGPIDLATLSQAYPGWTQLSPQGEGMRGGFTLTAAQQAVADMVASRIGAEMTGAFAAGLASTALHHLLTQATHRLPEGTHFMLNKLLIPAIRSIVYAVVAYHFTTGATTFTRVAFAGAPALVQSLVLVAPLPRLIRSIAMALNMVGLTYAAIELIRYNVMPAFTLLATLVGGQVAHVLMAALHELVKYLSPVEGQQAERLEEDLFHAPESSVMSSLVAKTGIGSVVADASPEPVKQVASHLAALNDRLADAVDVISTLRPLTQRAASKLEDAMCTKQLDEVTSVEMSPRRAASNDPVRQDGVSEHGSPPSEIDEDSASRSVERGGDVFGIVSDSSSSSSSRLDDLNIRVAMPSDDSDQAATEEGSADAVAQPIERGLPRERGG